VPFREQRLHGAGLLLEGVAQRLPAFAYAVGLAIGRPNRAL